MIKHFFTKVLLLALFVSANAFAITIINTNRGAVNYQIKENLSCVLSYSKGRLSPGGGQVIWTETTLYHPEKVCVHASGLSSVFGAFAKNLNNDTCILKIVNNGFMQGIKIEEVSGC
jgi:hypothetical protein